MSFEETEILREKDRVKALVYERIDAPIELHIASRDEFEGWYKRFIGFWRRFRIYGLATVFGWVVNGSINILEFL